MGEELCTRDGRLLTPIGVAASAFQAVAPANKMATPAKAKSICEGFALRLCHGLE
jgi:hypothetical protein